MVKNIKFSDFFKKGFSDFQGFSEALKNNYIIHLAGFPESKNPLEFYEKLAKECGIVQEVNEDLATGNATESKWVDIRYDVLKAETFRHSNTRQPLHTDAAYTSYDLDVNFFFCKVNAEFGGATTFIPGDFLCEVLTKYNLELYNQLCSIEVKFGKGDNQFKVAKIIDFDEKGVKLNWNYFRVLDSNSTEVKELCRKFHKFLETYIVDAGLLQGVKLLPGEAVFFQDDRILHGRESFLGNRTLIKGGFNFFDSES